MEERLRDGAVDSITEFKRSTLSAMRNQVLTQVLSQYDLNMAAVFSVVLSCRV